LGLRAIQYFEMLRACILFYNLSYYSLSYNLIQNLQSINKSYNACCFFVLYTFNPLLASPFEQFMDDDILFLSFSIIAVFFNFVLEEDDYSDDDFFTIFDDIIEDIFDQASTAVLGC
jgi:hypothetical protein